MRRDPLLQLVGQATMAGWQRFRFLCLMCRHEGVVELAGRRYDERLASIGRRASCTRCRRRTDTNCWIEGDKRKLPVHFEGNSMSPVEHHG